MSKAVEIMLVDDHKLFRDGLKFVLDQIKDLKVVAEASNGKEFLEIIETVDVDLVLMDISMPELDGIQATMRAMQVKPDLKIIALSMYSEEEYYNKMLEAGVKGFILKETGKEELERAIREVLDGGSYFSQKLLTSIIANINKPGEKKVSPQDESHLTRRELEVLQLICEGLTNSEIAEKLFISTRTVEGHKTSLITKTGVKSSISLVLYALRNNMVSI